MRRTASTRGVIDADEECLFLLVFDRRQVSMSAIETHEVKCSIFHINHSPFYDVVWRVVRQVRSHACSFLCDHHVSWSSRITSHFIVLVQVEMDSSCVACYVLDVVLPMPPVRPCGTDTREEGHVQQLFHKNSSSKLSWPLQQTWIIKH